MKFDRKIQRIIASMDEQAKERISLLINDFMRQQASDEIVKAVEMSLRAGFSEKEIFEFAHKIAISRHEF